MTKSNQIRIFDDRKVRTVWDSETEDSFRKAIEKVTSDARGRAGTALCYEQSLWKFFSECINTYCQNCK